LDNKLFRYILIAVIIVAAISAGYLAYQRHTIETGNDQVEVALLYNEIEQFAVFQGNTVDEMLEEFKKAGATGILFKEESLKELFSRDSLLDLGGDAKIALFSGRDLINMASFLGGKQNFLKDIKPRYIYLSTTDEATYRRIEKNLQLKLPRRLLHFPKKINGVYFIGITPNYADITGARKASVGIGFPREKMAKVKENGLNILVQIGSWPVRDSENLQEVFNEYQNEFAPFKENISLIAFNDSTIPGFPSQFQSLAEEVTEFNVPLGFVENFIFKQAGIKNLGRVRTAGVDLSKRIARLHAISEGEMIKFSNMGPQKAKQTAIARFLLAASERNVRVLLVRLFPGFTLEDNVKYVGELVEALKNEGFTLGKANTFDKDITSQSARTLLILIIGMGVIAAGLLLLDILGMTHLGLVLACIGTIGWLVIFIFSLVINPDTSGLFEQAVKLMALASVIIFPTLAVTITLKEREAGSLQAAIVRFLKLTGISLIGALLMVGLLAHLHYMLKLDQFRGVTAGLLTPILLVSFIFYFWKAKEGPLEKARSLLKQPVTVLLLVMAGFFAGIALLLVVRAGNSGIVFGFEEQFRNILQNLLGVRPRTKELLGHPIMLLLLYLGYKHRLLPLLIFGTIGQVSMVNTFAHIHTPFVISIIRTFHGLWLGIFGGIVLIMLYHFAIRLKERYLHG